MGGYTILLADDERIEREGLSLFLQRNIVQPARVECVSNGIELLTRAEAIRPDVIIADVEMPGMNGLDSLAVLRQKGLDFRTIIFSAYNHFEYAREAIHLEADAFLLKSTKREEILKTVNQCLERVAEGRREAEDRHRMETLVKEILPIVEADFITSILLDEVNEIALERYLDLLGIRFHTGCMASFRFPEYDLLGMLENVRDGELAPRYFLRNCLNDSGKALIGPIVNRKVTVFFSFEEETTEYRIRTFAIELASRACHLYRKETGCTLFAGIGNYCMTIRDLAESYRQSIRSLSETSGADFVRHFGDIGAARLPSDPFQRDESIIMQLIDNKNDETLNAQLKRTFADVGPLDISMDAKKDMVLSFVIAAWNRVREFFPGTVSLKDALDFPLASLPRVGTHPALLEWLLECIKLLIEFQREGATSTVRIYIRSATQFIDQNYMKNISLDTVAEATGVSSYYLSHLFRKELGTNYIRYLTNFRMKTAARILEREKLPLEKIAPLVGYSNPYYFIKLFKKYQG